MNLEFAAIQYPCIHDRIRAEDPQIDEQTLADTVEGLTDLHEILTAIIRGALTDEALAKGLKLRIAEMEDRLDRIQDRAAKRRQPCQRHDDRSWTEEALGARFHRLNSAGNASADGYR